MPFSREAKPSAMTRVAGAVEWDLAREGSRIIQAKCGFARTVSDAPVRAWARPSGASLRSSPGHP
jgi:hypothetical protein